MNYTKQDIDSVQAIEPFQLTKHAVGSILEIWTISWPLMLGLISANLMIFMDRLFLAKHSLQAMNAGANASLAYFSVLAIPIAVCAISEVLVGKLHGKDRLKEIGKPVWQLIWFALLLSPVFLCAFYWAPLILFKGTGNEVNETIYFQTLISFAPFACFSIVLNGFFIGIGRVKIVALCTLIANLFNIIIGYPLILGWGPISSLGVLGAGLAMGISQFLQFLILFYFFLQKKNRQTFGSHRLQFNFAYLKDGLKIGVPAGLAHFMEIFAHFIFFQILITAGGNLLTTVILVQSFYMLIAFLIEAQSKGVSSITANLLGARKYHLIPGVLKSAMKLHAGFFVVFLTILLFMPQTLVSLFISEKERIIFQNPGFIKAAFQAELWMSVFFLFDGFTWILVGFLTAAGDTKFLLYISTLVHWTVYLLSAYFFIGRRGEGAEVAWMIVAFCSIIMFLIFLWRFRSENWLKREIISIEAESV